MSLREQQKISQLHDEIACRQEIQFVIFTVLFPIPISHCSGRSRAGCLDSARCLSCRQSRLRRDNHCLADGPDRSTARSLWTT